MTSPETPELSASTRANIAANLARTLAQDTKTRLLRDADELIRTLQKMKADLTAGYNVWTPISGIHYSTIGTKMDMMVSEYHAQARLATMLDSIAK